MEDNNKTNETQNEKTEVSPMDFFNQTMNTVPTKYHSHGGLRFTPKKPKRKNIKHGNRKKK